MKRRIAVLGLALAMSATGTAEQTIVPLSEAGAARPSEAMTVRVELVRMASGGPAFTRIHLTRRGTEELILESSGFTVQVTPTETTIRSLGRLVMVGEQTTGHGSNSELRFGPDGYHEMLANDFRPIRR